MILALAVSASLDVTYEVDSLRYGGITRPTSVTRVPGGKALNAARVAHALGADVVAVAALGGASGVWIAHELRRAGIPTDIVDLVAETRTCTSIVETSVASATTTDIYEPATRLTSREWGAFATAARDAATPGEWVLLSGSLPPGVPPTEVAALLSSLREFGAKIAVDSSGAGLEALVASADLVKVNLDEARELLGTETATADAACRQLRALHGGEVIVTDGIRGAVAHTNEGEFLVPAPSRQGRYPVGSGDAFLGGLLASLTVGESWEVALATAADAAMRNALVPGPGVLAE